MIDKNNNKWKFKAVDLTEWNGSLQHDYFHVQWAGKYDGGQYSSGSYNFNLKVTIIDQGANYSDSYYNFSGTIPALAVIISGPSTLTSGQTGTWTANASGGKSPYHYAWQYYRECSNVSKPIDIEPKAPPCGTWFNFGSDSKTASRSDSYDFRVKVTVTDANNTSVSSTKYIDIGLNKTNLAENNSLTENLLERTELFANYPNPFNPTTQISYQIKESGLVQLIVYDALGREVQELVNEQKQPGRYTVQFDGSNLTSGIYFVKMKTQGYTATKKIVLAK